MIGYPAGIGAELRAQLLEHYTPEQVVELLLDVISWSQQKILVALRIDPPVDPDRLTLLVLADDLTWNFVPDAAAP